MLFPTLLALSALVGGNEDAHYLDASLDLDGKLLSWRFLDWNHDGRRELFLAIGVPNGERELRVHRLDESGLEREASTTVRVLSDVVAWGLANVRDEEGSELLLLTRSGAWSYSLTASGYRDNVTRLAHEELIYDMPDPHALPYWGYVLPGDDRDAVLLPGRDQLSIWGPPIAQALEAHSASDASYAQHSTFAVTKIEATLAGLRGDSRNRGDGPRVELGGSGPFLVRGSDAAASLLQDTRACRAPALVDLNGDGALDLIASDSEQLQLYVAGPSGLPAEPTRTEALPEALHGNDDHEVELRLHDLNGDGWLDLLAQVADEADGLENRLHRVLVFYGSEANLVREAPDQVLRFEAGDIEVQVADIDADGAVDLAVQKLELPSLVGAVTGIEFTFSQLMFPGTPSGFARRPALSEVQRFDEETAVEITSNRVWTHDCNGDGTADLVEADLLDDISIRRVRRETSRMRGDRLSLDPSPWKHFEVEGPVDSLVVDDFNGDGLGDIVSASDEHLTVLLSVRRQTR